MRIFNRKFNREYEGLERVEAGIVLNGSEAKSIRMGRLKLEDSFVKILGNEAYLVNAQIPLYEFAYIPDYDVKRTRKLLLHKKELIKFKIKMATGGLTLVPVSCYNKHGHVKLEIALVRGRKDVEKRRLEKRKDIELDQKREMKEYYR